MFEKFLTLPGKCVRHTDPSQRKEAPRGGSSLPGLQRGLRRSEGRARARAFHTRWPHNLGMSRLGALGGVFKGWAGGQPFPGRWRWESPSFVILDLVE